MQVEIWHDVVCPWCYIGKRRFERALEQVDLPVEITWRSFRLDPSVPPGGGDFRLTMARKFGGDRRMEAMFERVRAIGAADGLELNFDRIGRRFDTTDAHRLEKLAARDGLGDAAVEQLFRAYFTDGRDLSDIEELVRVAHAIGMDGDVVREELTGGAMSEAVNEDFASARDAGVTGVPLFVINGSFGIPGAQDVDVFVASLQRVRRRLDAGA
jgi:predicted DsbA family dithiol-disulfide isomerase